jgi:hypothetical protein
MNADERTGDNSVTSAMESTLRRELFCLGMLRWFQRYKKIVPDRAIGNNHLVNQIF